MANLRRRSRSPSSEYGVADGDTRRPSSLDARSISSSQSNRYWSNSVDDDYEPSAITINIFDTPSSEDVTQTNVFATPPGSSTSSRTNSMLDVNSFSTPTPSLRRHSLSLSLPRSPSPLPVADGGRGSYFGGSNRHQRSFSTISRATTPSSIASGSGWTGPTLNRSNTTGTTNSSTLYSLPSQMTGSSSPPSPIMSNAHARHYGHHHQSLSMNSSELGSVDGADPFADGFVVPVGDGFAPRHTHQRRGPASAVGSQASTLPPPYSEYPGQHIPSKIDENAAAVMPLPIAPVPAFDQSTRDATRTAGIGVAGNDPESSNLRGGDGENGHVVYNGEYNTEDHSGATKEWRDKKWLIGWRFLMVMAAIILAVGIAVGLGVGLGIGLRSSKKDSGAAHATATPTPEHTQLPDSETANIFDPDDVFPDLPSGSFFMGPMLVEESNQDCVIKPIDASAPDFFKEGSASLWTCNIPEMKPFLWNIQPLPANLTGTQITNLASDPKPLQGAEYELGKWGGYTVTSKEGETERWGDNEWKDKDGNWNMYSPKAWREGLQGPSFWNQPLMFLNSTEADDDESEEEVARTYKFGLLYEKKVLLREATMIANWVTGINEAKNLGDGDLIAEGELVWMCSWNKTMFEVELSVDEVASVDTVGFDLPAFVSAYSDVDFDGIEEIFAPEDALEAKADEYQAEGSGEASNTVNYQDGQIITEEESELNDVSVFDVEFDNQLDDNDSSNSGTEAGTVKDDGHSSTVTSTTSSTTSATTTPTIVSRSSKGPHRYPKKVKIREYRPIINRLKDVQGIDRTEGNRDERAQYGNINCVKMIAIAAHGLRTVVGEDGEGKVTLKQKPTDNKYDCLCAWGN